MSNYSDKLKAVVEYMNKRFGPESEENDSFLGPKPSVIRYDDKTAIATWACGAVVCIGSAMFYISEDDGFWFLPEEVKIDRIDKNGNYPDWAVDCGCKPGGTNIAWAESLANAILELKKYVDENGEPVYYSGTTNICYYRLSKKGE